jgi:hypothetical protein
MTAHVFWTQLWPLIVFGAAALVAAGYALHLIRQRKRDARWR